MKICSSVGGYSGQPATIVGMYDDDTGILVVAKSLKYREDKPGPDFALISNMDLAAVDFRFSNEHMREAIRAYYNRMAQGTLDILDAMARFKPDNRIERDKIDETGQKYRISEDIDNGQIAVLAMVCYIERQKGYSAAISMSAEIAEMYGVLSI